MEIAGNLSNLTPDDLMGCGAGLGAVMLPMVPAVAPAMAPSGFRCFLESVSYPSIFSPWDEAISTLIKYLSKKKFASRIIARMMRSFSRPILLHSEKESVQPMSEDR